jgi:hypothetical protein
VALAGLALVVLVEVLAVRAEAFVALGEALAVLETDALFAVVFAAALEGAALFAGATAAVVFLDERAVVVARVALIAADALRPRPAVAVLLVVAFVARPATFFAVAALAVAFVAFVAFVTLVVLATRPLAVVARPRAEDAFVAATFLAAVFRPAAFFELRATLKPAAGLKRMPLEAAILTGWPVRGLRPVRAFLAVGLKLPNP